MKIKKVNSLQWIFEPLEKKSNFIQKRMFGCRAGYLDDRLVLVLADTQEPWNGVLIPTERSFHPDIRKEFPETTPHPVLGKWLYISQNSPSFETVASDLVELILRGDLRFGVAPKPKKLARHKKRSKR